MLHIRAGGCSWPIRNTDPDRVMLQIAFAAQNYGGTAEVWDDRTDEVVMRQTANDPDPQIVSGTIAAARGIAMALGAEQTTDGASPPAQTATKAENGTTNG